MYYMNTVYFMCPTGHTVQRSSFAISLAAQKSAPSPLLDYLNPLVSSVVDKTLNPVRNIDDVNVISHGIIPTLKGNNSF